MDTLDEQSRLQLAGRVADAIRTLDLAELKIEIWPPGKIGDQTMIVASYRPPLQRVTGVFGAGLPGEVAATGGSTVHRQVFVDRWGRVGFCGWHPEGFARAMQQLRDEGTLILM